MATEGVKKEEDPRGDVPRDTVLLLATGSEPAPIAGDPCTAQMREDDAGKLTALTASKEAIIKDKPSFWQIKRPVVSTLIVPEIPWDGGEEYKPPVAAEDFTRSGYVTGIVQAGEITWAESFKDLFRTMGHGWLPEIANTNLPVRKIEIRQYMRENLKRSEISKNKLHISYGDVTTEFLSVHSLSLGINIHTIPVFQISAVAHPLTYTVTHDAIARWKKTYMDMRFSLSGGTADCNRIGFVGGRKWRVLKEGTITWSDSYNNYDAASPVIREQYRGLLVETGGGVRDMPALVKAIGHMKWETNIAGDPASRIFDRVSQKKCQFSRLIFRLWTLYYAALLHQEETADKEFVIKGTKLEHPIQVIEEGKLLTQIDTLLSTTSIEPFVIGRSLHGRSDAFTIISNLIVGLSYTFKAPHHFVLTRFWPPIYNVRIFVYNDCPIKSEPILARIYPEGILKTINYLGVMLGQTTFFYDIGRTVASFICRPEGDKLWMGYSHIKMRLPPFHCQQTLFFDLAQGNTGDDYVPPLAPNIYKSIWEGNILYMWQSVFIRTVLMERGFYSYAHTISTNLFDECPRFFRDYKNYGMWEADWTYLTGEEANGIKLNLYAQAVALRMGLGAIFNCCTAWIEPVFFEPRVMLTSQSPTWSETLLVWNVVHAETAFGAIINGLGLDDHYSSERIYYNVDVPSRSGRASTGHYASYLRGGGPILQLRANDRIIHEVFYSSLPIGPDTLPVDGLFKTLRWAQNASITWAYAFSNRDANLRFFREKDCWNNLVWERDTIHTRETTEVKVDAVYRDQKAVARALHMMLSSKQLEAWVPGMEEVWIRYLARARSRVVLHDHLETVSIEKARLSVLCPDLRMRVWTHPGSSHDKCRTDAHLGVFFSGDPSEWPNYEGIGYGMCNDIGEEVVALPTTSVVVGGQNLIARYIKQERNIPISYFEPDKWLGHDKKVKTVVDLSDEGIDASTISVDDSEFKPGLSLRPDSQRLLKLDISRTGDTAEPMGSRYISLTVEELRERLGLSRPRNTMTSCETQASVALALAEARLVRSDYMRGWDFYSFSKAHKALHAEKNVDERNAKAWKLSQLAAALDKIHADASSMGKGFQTVMHTDLASIFDALCWHGWYALMIGWHPNSRCVLIHQLHDMIQSLRAPVSDNTTWSNTIRGCVMEMGYMCNYMADLQALTTAEWRDLYGCDGPPNIGEPQFYEQFTAEGETMTFILSNPEYFPGMFGGGSEDEERGHANSGGSNETAEGAAHGGEQQDANALEERSTKCDGSGRCGEFHEYKKHDDEDRNGDAAPKNSSCSSGTAQHSGSSELGSGDNGKGGHTQPTQYGQQTKHNTTTVACVSRSGMYLANLEAGSKSEVGCQADMTMLHREAYKLESKANQSIAEASRHQPKYHKHPGTGKDKYPILVEQAIVGENDAKKQFQEIASTLQKIVDTAINTEKSIDPRFDEVFRQLHAISTSLLKMTSMWDAAWGASCAHGCTTNADTLRSDGRSTKQATQTVPKRKRPGKTAGEVESPKNTQSMTNVTFQSKTIAAAKPQNATRGTCVVAQPCGRTDGCKETGAPSSRTSSSGTSSRAQRSVIPLQGASSITPLLQRDTKPITKTCGTIAKSSSLKQTTSVATCNSAENTSTVKENTGYVSGFPSVTANRSAATCYSKTTSPGLSTNQQVRSYLGVALSACQNTLPDKNLHRPYFTPRASHKKGRTTRNLGTPTARYVWRPKKPSGQPSYQPSSTVTPSTRSRSDTSMDGSQYKSRTRYYKNYVGCQKQIDVQLLLEAYHLLFQQKHAMGSGFTPYRYGIWPGRCQTYRVGASS